MQCNSLTCFIKLLQSMSFRETFTRNSGGSDNLRYDDTAAYHFYVTILIIVVGPLLYSIFKTILNPFSNIPQIHELQKMRHFRDKISKFKKENRFSYLTFKFVLKVLIAIVMIYGVFSCAQTILSSTEDVKGFDPYQILQVEPDAPIQKIKKAYRKLALLYHPDRNQNNPQASAKFIMISKAYECLTDQQAKQKCLKYGNPDGASSFNVGIALPSFLIKKQNHIVIMGIIFLFVVILLPIYLIHYHSQMNKYDDFGMLNQNQKLINYSLNQQLGMKDCIKMVTLCAQFAHLHNKRNQNDKIEALVRQLDQDEKKTFTKKKYRPILVKIFLLVDARMNQKQVAPELEEDYRFIMKTVPIIIKSAIHTASARSSEQIQQIPNYFIGKTCIYSLILFGQYFIQGKSYQNSQSFSQLDLSQDEVEKILKKKKQKKITSLQTLINKQQERQFLLNLLEPNRAIYIKQCLQYFPKVECQCEIKVGDDNTIGAQQNFQISINVKSNRLGNFCSSPTYPFLKNEGWHIIVSQTTGIFILYYQFFTFDQLSKTFKINYAKEKPGKYSINIQIMSDSYFGLDIEKIIKYQVGPVKQMIQHHEPEHQEKQEESLIRQMLKQLSPQQEQQVSDKQDEIEQKQIKKN